MSNDKSVNRNSESPMRKTHSEFPMRKPHSIKYIPFMATTHRHAYTHLT